MRLDTIDRSLKSSMSSSGFVRIKLWNRQHWVVYSDNPNIIGRWVAGDPELEETFRGEVTASMVYDGQPVIDHFKLVDADTLLGVMNGKGVTFRDQHYFFVLERED